MDRPKEKTVQDVREKSSQEQTDKTELRIVFLLAILLAFTLSIFFSYMLKIAPKKSDYIGVWDKLSSTEGLPYIDLVFEYPVLIGMVVKALTWLSDSYEAFLGLNAALALFSGIGSTIILYKMSKDNGRFSVSSISIFWIFAPSMLMYGVYNWDLFGLFFMLFSIYMFLQNKLTLSSISLAIGICIKLFPVFLLPIYLLKTKQVNEKVKIVSLVGVTWLLINLPFAVANFDGWFYPYRWQIIMRPPNPDNLWGLLIKEFGGGYIDFYQVHDPEVSASLSVVLSATLLTSYLAMLYFKREENILKLGFYVFTVFLLFNKIYSPQYNLWLLPFIFLVKAPIVIFYLFDVPNFLILGAHTPWFIFSPQYSYHIAILLVVRHIALMLMLLFNLKERRILMDS